MQNIISLFYNILNIQIGINHHCYLASQMLMMSAHHYCSSCVHEPKQI